MDAQFLDYQQLAASAVTNPETAFRDAFDAGDLDALAMVSILVPGPAPETKVANFTTFVSHHDADHLAAHLILGVFEQASQLPGELVNSARQHLRGNFDKLPIDAAQISRACSVVRDKSAGNDERAALLYWVWRHDEDSARRVSHALLQDLEEPYALPAWQALSVVGAEPGPEARNTLWEYGKRYLEAPPQTPGHQPKAALRVIDAVSKPSSEDIEPISELLLGVARQGIAVGDDLKRFYKRVPKTDVAPLVSSLAGGGHAAWLANQFLPGLLRSRARDFAPTAGETWWPAECRAVFSTTAWHEVDDRLYPVVVRRLHRTDDESAKVQVRNKIAQRCRETSATASTAMPRIGMRSLLKLALAGQIATDDSALVEALQVVDSSLAEVELMDASWKLPERARRLGEIIAHIGGDHLASAVESSFACKPETTVALLKGAGEALAEAIDEVFEMVADNEPVLTGLCQISDSACTKALERWAGNHSMVSFRALEQTSMRDERLSAVPVAVRGYDRISPSEREELLDAFGPGDNRVEVLIAVLADRSKGGAKPTEADLTLAIRLLGEHLSDGFSPDGVLETLGVICEEQERRDSPSRIRGLGQESSHRRRRQPLGTALNRGSPSP